MPEPVLTIRLRGTSSFGDRIELTDEEIGLLRRKLEIEFDPTDLQKALDAFRLRSNLMVYIRLNELVSTLKKIARNPKSYNRHV
ncbi:MAG: hypothetical protein MRY72_10725, partial [Aquisalinus sp.]|nr:hypothetical protein [Aquisalinus sp.]